jgi:DNA repair protein RecO (recombination protein O)
VRRTASSVDLQIAEGRSLDVVTQAETLDPFAARMGSSYERYTAGTVMLETAERLVVEEKEPALQQFLLLVGALRSMSDTGRAPHQVLDSFLLRSLAVAGYAPTFEGCARCGVEGQHRSFSPAAGGMLCSTCRVPGSMNPAVETVTLLGALLAGDWVVVDASDPRHRREATGMVAAYLQWHLERGLKSLSHVER